METTMFEGVGKLYKEWHFDTNPNDLSTEVDGILYIERWVDVKGYEGIYLVSDFGRVKSLNKMVSYDGGNTFSLRKGRFLKPSYNRYGYLKIVLQNNKKRIYQNLHRLVASHFIENAKLKPDVNHKNGVKSQTFFLNLEWTTEQENSLHAVRTGLAKHSVGETHIKSKLTEAQVLNIRKEWDGTIPYRQHELAKKYNVSMSNISKILKREIWNHI